MPFPGAFLEAFQRLLLGNVRSAATPAFLLP
jgi:hypothetical protein